MTPLTPAIATAFDAAPEAREGLLRLRGLILSTGADLNVPVEEALRWGQPAYLAPKGSTIRLGQSRKGGTFALFVHCQSRLIPEFTQMFPGADKIEGTRAVLFDDVTQVDDTRHGWLIARALTYHQRGVISRAGSV